MEFKQTDADTRIIRYLQKNLSEEEKIQFYHWVESDPANKKRYFEVLRQIWCKITVLKQPV